MPRTLPGGMELELKRSGGFLPTVLLDLQTSDTVTYYWSDMEGNYPTALTGLQQYYQPWIKHAGPFRRTRDLTSDTGDLVIQNLSGNTIDRDVATALKTREFEGALAIVRLWMPLVGDMLDQFYFSLSEQNPSEDECTFRMLQIFDPATFDVADELMGELCPWRYKGGQCRSTGTALTCLHRFIDCSDPTRSAVESFSGILSIIPNANLNPPPVTVNPSGGGGKRFRRFHGGRLPVLE